MPKLTFLGHSAFLVESASTRLIIDPFLRDNPTATVDPADVSVDYVLLTHGHGDHIADAVEIAKSNDATVIAPFELANWCAGQGVEKTHPMHIGGAHNFPFGRVKLTIAHHGSSTPDGRYMGQPSGILVTLDGKTLYHAGDTALFYDMRLIGDMNAIDVAVLPIGDNFTMGIDDAVKAVEFLRPGTAVPCHYGTFDLIAVDPGEFVEKLRHKGFNGTVLEINGSLEY